MNSKNAIDTIFFYNGPENSLLFGFSPQ